VAGAERELGTKRESARARLDKGWSLGVGFDIGMGVGVDVYGRVGVGVGAGQLLQRPEGSLLCTCWCTDSNK